MQHQNTPGGSSKAHLILFAISISLTIGGGLELLSEELEVAMVLWALATITGYFSARKWPRGTR